MKKAIIICNVSSKEQEFKLPKEVKTNEEELLIHNYQVATEETVQEFTLRPYETRVYFV